MESSNQLLKIAINGACNWQFIIYLISFPFSIDENFELTNLPYNYVVHVSGFEKKQVYIEIRDGLR